jgi:hypothetical protein
MLKKQFQNCGERILCVDCKMIVFRKEQDFDSLQELLFWLEIFGFPSKANQRKKYLYFLFSKSQFSYGFTVIQVKLTDGFAGI